MLKHTVTAILFLSTLAGATAMAENPTYTETILSPAEVDQYLGTNSSLTADISIGSPTAVVTLSYDSDTLGYWPEATYDPYYRGWQIWNLYWPWWVHPYGWYHWGPTY